jgi:hypothetical protein
MQNLPVETLVRVVNGEVCLLISLAVIVRRTGESGEPDDEQDDDDHRNNGAADVDSAAAFSHRVLLPFFNCA